MQHIDIVVLTYNRENALTKCLNTIIGSTSSPCDIWIVDNASTDKTRETCESYAGNLPYIHYLRNNKNVGVCARNKALDEIYKKKKVSANDFIAFVDDDVWVNHNWDRVLLSYFLDAKVGACGPSGSYITPNWDQFVRGMRVDEANKQVFFEHGKMPPMGEQIDSLSGYCWMARSEIFKELRFDETRFFWFEEPLLHFQMLLDGWKLVQSARCAFHVSNRTGDVDWYMHNSGLKRIYDLFWDKREKLDLLYRRLGVPEPKDKQLIGGKAFDVD